MESQEAYKHIRKAEEQLLEAKAALIVAEESLAELKVIIKKGLGKC